MSSPKSYQTRTADGWTDSRYPGVTYPTRKEARERTAVRLGLSNVLADAHAEALTMDADRIDSAGWTRAERDAMAEAERAVVIPCYPLGGTPCEHEAERARRYVTSHDTREDIVCPCLDCLYQEALDLAYVLVHPGRGKRIDELEPQPSPNTIRYAHKARQKARHASRKVRGAHLATVQAKRQLAEDHTEAIAMDRERTLGKRRDGHSIRPVQQQASR